MKNELLLKKIKLLKKAANAVILAHLYQEDEIQEVADFTGDSLELSRKAAETKAQVIVFCGVKFMAETAKILSPDKTVLLPAKDAGCPLADTIDSERLSKLRSANPGVPVVCYVNTSAEIKAHSDYCCTSSNAVNLIKHIPQNRIIFIPDQNLGSYVAKKVPEKELILWEGSCITHHRVTARHVDKVKKLHPQVPILVHPECRPEVIEKADFVGSTSQILQYARKSSAATLIIGTEMGVLYRLRKENPHKNFYLLAPGLFCPNMKKTKLEDVYQSLANMKNQISVTEEIRIKALSALNRMLENLPNTPGLLIE